MMVDYYEDLADLLATSYEEEVASTDELEQDSRTDLPATEDEGATHPDIFTLYLPFPEPCQPPAHR